MIIFSFGMHSFSGLLITNDELTKKLFYFYIRPSDTPFEDGTFRLLLGRFLKSNRFEYCFCSYLEFTESYPNKPPAVRFTSKMFHPNGELTFFSFCFSTNFRFLYLVYNDGSICLDILQNRWSPTYDVSAILTSIQVNNDDNHHF